MYDADPYLIPEPINRLPMKRVYDFKLRKLRQVTKLPKEFELADNEILIKIKMIAINYGKDFNRFKAVALSNKQGITLKNVVPGNKFLGKIYASNDSNLAFPLDNSKFIIFPYTNCIQRGNKQCCKSCLQNGSNEYGVEDLGDHLKRRRCGRRTLPCLGQYELGLNLDGGLQDFLKLKNALDLLVRIPDNVSSHDSLLLLDYSLPFYSAFKSSVSPYYNYDTDRLLIILNDYEKELNDVLVIFKIFRLNISNILILDHERIESMSAEDISKFQQKFNLIFNFSTTLSSLKFCFRCLISTGLESTKTRYQIILFNQSNSFDLTEIMYSIDKDYDLNDKTITKFRMNWFHKFDLVELLNHISLLNSNSSRPSYSSIDSFSNQTLFSSNMSINLGSTNFSKYSPLKIKLSDTNMNQQESNHNQSSQPDETINNVLSTNMRNNHIRLNSNIRSCDNLSIPLLDVQYKNHWLFYDKDVDLTNDFDKYDKLDTSVSLRHINKLIGTNNNFTRICYSNKPNKSTKLNAFIFT